MIYASKQSYAVILNLLPTLRDFSRDPWIALTIAAYEVQCICDGERDRLVPNETAIARPRL